MGNVVRGTSTLGKIFLWCFGRILWIVMKKRGCHLLCVSESIREELSVSFTGTNLFFIPTLTISGNLFTVFSIFWYVCNLFLLIPKINSLVIII